VYGGIEDGLFVPWIIDDTDPAESEAVIDVAPGVLGHDIRNA